MLPYRTVTWMKCYDANAALTIANGVKHNK